MVKHEKKIDDSLLELKVKATDFVGFAWHEAVIYGQKGFTGILNRVTFLRQHYSLVLIRCLWINKAVAEKLHIV